MKVIKKYNIKIKFVFMCSRFRITKFIKQDLRTDTWIPYTLESCLTLFAVKYCNLEFTNSATNLGHLWIVESKYFGFF